MNFKSVGYGASPYEQSSNMTNVIRFEEGSNARKWTFQKRHVLYCSQAEIRLFLTHSERQVHETFHPSRNSGSCFREPGCHTSAGDLVLPCNLWQVGCLPRTSYNLRSRCPAADQRR